MWPEALALELILCSTVPLIHPELLGPPRPVVPVPRASCTVLSWPHCRLPSYLLGRRACEPMGGEPTIVTPSQPAGDRSPWTEPCSFEQSLHQPSRPVIVVHGRFLATAPSEQLTDCSSGWFASLCAACGVSHAQESGR